MRVQIIENRRKSGLDKLFNFSTKQILATENEVIKYLKFKK